MVAVLLILDGASEPLEVETSLEAARTPNLDRLAAGGTVGLLRTVSEGLPVGSETAIPALLGWVPTGAVDRGALEAAAVGIELGAGEQAWRVDVLGRSGERVGDEVAARAAAELSVRLPEHTVRWLRGHRLLVTGASSLERLGGGGGVKGALAEGEVFAEDGVGELRVWPEGVVPPRILDERTVMVAAAGAAAGAARLLGAAVVTPSGATGGIDTDLGAKAAAAECAIAEGSDRVVIHVGAPDEAAHLLDRDAKIAALERIDADLVPRLTAAVTQAGGTLRICPDHGCDPRTGQHCADPVPYLDWSAGAQASPSPPSALRLTERSGVGFGPYADITHSAVRYPRYSRIRRTSVEAPA
ncbi:MAG TPA: hypothetical protein VFX45_10725 [Solirubrobacterales bacterium]|nr:hypothetical protein [Solirubrobacterales bacterium]